MELPNKSEPKETIRYIKNNDVLEIDMFVGN
jgi:hypothetical protein